MTRRQAMLALAATWAAFRGPEARAQKGKTFDGETVWRLPDDITTVTAYTIGFHKPEDKIVISLGTDTVSFTAQELMDALKPAKTIFSTDYFPPL